MAEAWVALAPLWPGSTAITAPTTPARTWAGTVELVDVLGEPGAVVRGGAVVVTARAVVDVRRAAVDATAVTVGAGRGAVVTAPATLDATGAAVVVVVTADRAVVDSAERDAAVGA